MVEAGELEAGEGAVEDEEEIDIESEEEVEITETKKGNKSEQKRAEGAIRDNEIHVDKLNKDTKFQRKKYR